MADISYKVANFDTVNERTTPDEDDLRFSATAMAKKKDAVTFNETLLALEFPDNDEGAYVFIIAQFPHDMQPDSAIRPHFHVRLTKAGQPVFKMDYKWYNPNGTTVPTSWTTFTMDTNTFTWTAGTQSAMVYGSSGNTEIDGTGMTESSIMLIKLYRSASDTYSGDCLVDEFDFHYTRSRFGNEA